MNKCNCLNCGKEIIGTESFIYKGQPIYKFYCSECNKIVYITNPGIIKIMEGNNENYL